MTILYRRNITNSIFYICYDNYNNLHRLLSIPTLPKYTVGSVPGHCLHVRVAFVCFFVFLLLFVFVCLFFFLGGGVFFLFLCCCFFLLQNAPITMIFDDAIYLFIYIYIYIFFLHFISMLLRPSHI